MELDSLDLSKCLFDPRKPSILNDTKDIPEFDLKNSYRKSIKAMLIYIVLMYDEHSPLRREIKNLPARKAMAMELSGFGVDSKTKRFERFAERIMEGLNQDVNAAIVKYLALQNSPKFVQLIAYETLYYAEVAKVQNHAYTSAKDIIANIDKLSVAIDKLTEDIVGGKGEAESILAAIYKEVTKDLDVTPEKISQMIMESGNVPNDWNPYAEWKDGEMKETYKPDKIKFVADH